MRMNIIKKMYAKKYLRKALETISASEQLEKIRFKVTFNSNTGLKYFIMDGVNLVREDNIYNILNCNPETHKKNIDEVEETLRDAFQNISIDKKLFIPNIDIRFYLGTDNKGRTKLSMYLFDTNKPIEELKIDNYL